MFMKELLKELMRVANPNQGAELKQMMKQLQEERCGTLAMRCGVAWCGETRSVEFGLASCSASACLLAVAC